MVPREPFYNQTQSSTSNTQDILSEMHQSMMGSTGEDADGHLAHNYASGNQHGSQGHDGWNDVQPYHQSTMADYGSFAYGASHVLHGLPSESINKMPPPPVPLQSVQHHHQHQSHIHLPMLTIPTHQPAWPSMLTNPNNNNGSSSNNNSYTSQSAPPTSMPSSIPTPSPILTRTPTTHHPQARKTLTDDDRRRMCQYHLDHPDLKQTEIGALFGVERSTVSKVLRLKEKYLLSPDERSQSPIKRSKAKLPDIDKAMTSWLKRQVRAGVELSDDELLQQARHFAMNSGGNCEAIIKALTQTWVEKFKQKNGVGMPRLLRRASETSIPNHAKMTISPIEADALTTSPTIKTSPLSPAREDEDVTHGFPFLPFSPDGGGSNAQNTTSLNAALNAQSASSLVGGGTVSPSATLHYSPVPNTGSFVSNDQSRHLQVGIGSNFQRPRSQTFPTLDLEYLNQQNSMDTSPPRYQSSATAPSSALDSPVHELTHAHFGLDHAIASSPHLRHSSSNSSMAARSTTPIMTSGLSNTPVGSSPTSPTQEEARKAADTLLNYIQSAASSGFVDQNEYSTILRLTEKLRIHQHQLTRSISMASIGGLSRIPEGDAEILHQQTVDVKAESNMTG